MPREDTGSWSYLMPLVNLDQSAGLILSTDPVPSCVVSRTATRPGTLATSTQLPPCPPL